MKKSKIYLMLTALFAATALASCTKDDIASESFADEEVRFILSVPAAGSPTTRSLDGSRENEVAEAAVLVFSVDGSGNETYDYHKIVSTPSITNTASPYKAEFKVMLTAGTDKKVVMIGNPSAANKTYIAGLGAGVAKTTVLQNLIYSNSSRWAADGSGTYTPIPMYGETGKVTIAPGGTIGGISMIRMLARIDVVLNLAGGSKPFTIDKVHLVNYNTNGLVAPTWDSRGVTSATAATAPNLPSGLSHTSSIHEYSTSPYLGEIYTFESAAANDAGGLAGYQRQYATCLVIEGKYNNSSTATFYRVDFTYNGSNGPQGDYMPLLRNYRYNVQITDVQGPGHATAALARAAYGMQSNMMTRTISYNLGVIKDMVFDGQHMLGVESARTTLSAAKHDAGSINNKLVLFTDYPGTWTAQASNSATAITAVANDPVTGTPWFTLGNSSGTWGSITEISLLTAANTRYRCDRQDSLCAYHRRPPYLCGRGGAKLIPLCPQQYCSEGR